ncbi:hypothetical protein D3C87_1623290 [compost metagenome]
MNRTGRLPIRSASRPKTKAPTSMPRKKDVPDCRASGMVTPNVAAIDGALKPIARTCIASAAHTRPKMMKRRRWNRPTPAASMPCSMLIRDCMGALHAYRWSLTTRLIGRGCVCGHASGRMSVSRNLSAPTHSRQALNPPARDGRERCRQCSSVPARTRLQHRRGDCCES